MPLGNSLSARWDHIEGFLFPLLREEVGPLSASHERLITVLDFAPVTQGIIEWRGLPGRPPSDRQALARAFVARAVLGEAQTRKLIDRLHGDAVLRRLCGWETRGAIPSEATFSRAFAELAARDWPALAHEALIERAYKDRIVGHVSRDATAIAAREKPVRTGSACLAAPTRKRGRPHKGEAAQPKEPRRLERQASMTLAQMLADLPRACAIGSKRNAKGHTASWIGYKLHMDTADGGVPISCLLTSASLHDSQAALPLAAMTAKRIVHLYDVMDSAYDAAEIHADSAARGHVALIDKNPRRGDKAAMELEAKAKRIANYRLAEEVRYFERSTAERANGAIKDTYAGCLMRLRGASKIFCHLMFGVLVLSIEQLLRLARGPDPRPS